MSYTVINLLVIILLSYLIGSIPTSVWIGKLFYGIDVREHGSGNAGATNTFRVLGAKAGIPVFIFDTLKGWAPAFFAQIYASHFPLVADGFLIPIICGIVSVIGHVFPVYAQFRGGKGVATLLGMAIGIQPLSAGLSALVFLIILLFTKYVSLGSLFAGICFALITNSLLTNNSVSLTVFSILAVVLLFVTHKKNIKRLFAGTENKTYLYKKK